MTFTQSSVDVISKFKKSWGAVWYLNELHEKGKHEIRDELVCCNLDICHPTQEGFFQFFSALELRSTYSLKNEMHGAVWKICSIFYIHLQLW